VIVGEVARFQQLSFLKVAQSPVLLKQIKIVQHKAKAPMGITPEWFTPTVWAQTHHPGSELQHPARIDQRR
jgi:hypothetical protein